MTGSPGSRVRRAFSRAAASYDGAATVQRAVIAELLSALPAADDCARLLDIGCGTGAAFRGLQSHFPQAELIGLDFAAPMLARAPDGVQKIAAVATSLPLADASVDLVFSSLTYQWCALDAALAEARRVLRPGGRIALSTLGPATFHELRSAFAGLDDAPHVLPMLAPDAIERAAQTAGFAGIRRWQTTQIARFPDVASLFASIRRTGASEISPSGNHGGHGERRRGLLGKSAWATINRRLLAMADDQGELPLTYDVVYLLAEAPGAKP